MKNSTSCRQITLKIVALVEKHQINLMLKYDRCFSKLFHRMIDSLYMVNFLTYRERNFDKIFSIDVGMKIIDQNPKMKRFIVTRKEKANR